MKTLVSRLLPVLALALALAPVTALAADADGAEGTAATLRVNTPSSDAYVQYHGKLVVGINSRSTEYRWGGTSCGSKTLSADNVQLLQEAVRGQMRITPTYQSGQGTAKCLVGFSVRPPK